MNMKQIIINEALRTYRRLELSIVLCLVFLPVCLHAEELTEREVQTAVETWVRYVTSDAKPDAVIEQMEPYLVDGKTVAYIAHIAGGGFCLCGADDLVLPVYLYNPMEVYEEEHPGYQFILWEISARSEYFSKAFQGNAPEITTYEAAFWERAVYWQELITGRAPAKVEGLEASFGEPDKMELNLTTSWNQGAPYNNLCPMGDGGRCVVGCTATAMAQILGYWTWPSAGTGSHSYTWNGDQSCGGNVGGGTQSATFSDAYDWSNMPDNCAGGCSTAQQDALAELSYEVGVSIEMDYGVCGSVAGLGSVDDAFDDYFRYDNDAQYQMADSSAIATLTDETQWLCPVVMCGHTPTVGHTFVIYGYDKSTDPDRKFLINMGWGSGSSHVWYTYDSIPFPNHKQYVTRIAPENVKFVGDTNPGDGSPDDPYEDIEEAINYAPDGVTLIFKAGSTNTFSAGTLIINRPFTLRGYNAVIQ